MERAQSGRYLKVPANPTAIAHLMGRNEFQTIWATDRMDETWGNIVGPNYTINCIYGTLVYLSKVNCENGSSIAVIRRFR